jgi:hypothetical protein
METTCEKNGKNKNYNPPRHFIPSTMPAIKSIVLGLHGSSLAQA